MTEGDDRGPRFREKWHRLLDVAALPPELDRTALVLASRARADGTRAVASHRWLAARLGKSERTVRRWVAELDRLDWIHRDEKGTRKGSQVTANVYRLTVPEAASIGHSMDGRLMEEDNRPPVGDQPATETRSIGHAPAGNDRPPRTDPPSTSGTTPASVDRFLALYPETLYPPSRANVAAAWREALTVADEATILGALSAWSEHYATCEPRFRKAAVNWLRERRWEQPPPKVDGTPTDVDPERVLKRLGYEVRQAETDLAAARRRAEDPHLLPDQCAEARCELAAAERAVTEAQARLAAEEARMLA